MRPAALDRSDGIDALRGALALWVMLAHVVPWSVVSHGANSVLPPIQWLTSIAVTIFQPHGETNPAVLAFIVLSGYCIQKSWTANPDVRAFAIRRVFRIAPVFLIGVALGVIGFTVAGSASSPLAEALSGTSSIEPSCVIAKATTFAALAPTFHPCAYSGNAPLLTVVVEITLYAAFPLLLSLGRAKTVLICSTCFIVGLILSLNNNELFTWYQGSSLYGFLPFWWIGAAFAMQKQLPQRKFVVAFLIAWAILTLGCIFDKTAFFAHARKIPFCLLTGVAIMALERASSPKFASLIGRAGYSIYALHAPILYSLLIFGAPWWSAVIVAVLCGLVCFIVIERPIDRFGRAVAKRHPAPELRLSD